MTLSAISGIFLPATAALAPKNVSGLANADVAPITITDVRDSTNSSANGTKGLYKGSDGKLYVDDDALTSGATLSQTAIALTAKGKTWTSGKAEAIGLRVTASGYEVMMRQGVGTKAAYSVQAFDATGVLVGKPEKLSTVGMLEAETSYDQDFSGDTAKGDVIASVQDATDGAGQQIGLYKLTSGRMVIDLQNKAVNASVSGSVVYLTSKGKNWSPGTAEAVAVRQTNSGFEVLLQAGEGEKAKYSVQGFDATGSLSGKATVLTGATLTFSESDFKQEFNGDNVQGDYVTGILDREDSDGSVGLYKLKSGFLAAGNDNLAIGTSAIGMTQLTDKGRAWVSRTTPIAVASADGGGIKLIMKTGTGDKAKISEATFNADGVLTVKATAIRASDIKATELAYDQDFNDDGKVGNSAFNIKVNFTGDARYKPYFEAAASRWSEIILNDLADAENQSYNWTNVAGYSQLGNKTYGTIDDLLIEAIMYDGGNNNNLGSAGPVQSRADGSPIIGRMRFNTYYMDGMLSSNTFAPVILHEMGHILGLGTRWASLKNGAGDYTGTNALAQYSTLKGSAQTSIPIENDGGAGTAGAHWEEDIFDSELMTGWAENAPPMPLSKVTVGALQDLGYTVSYTMADSYSLPGASQNSPNASSVTQNHLQFHLWESMENGTVGLEVEGITINIKV